MKTNLVREKQEKESEILKQKKFLELQEINSKKEKER